MTKKLITLLLFIMIGSALLAQTIYSVTSSDELHKFEPDNTSSFIVLIDDTDLVIPFSDIAISLDNTRT